MGHGAIIQAILYMAVVLALAKPLGAYMARVYELRPIGIDRALGPVERLIYRVGGIRPDQEMTWKGYAFAVMLFNALGILVLYAIERLQGHLPLNPMHRPAVPPGLAFNTAVSFATNTNWQSYSGETTMSYLTQMVGLGVQNFLSAATGMAVLVALVRGFVRRKAEAIGNFWVDLVRSTLYILLPLACLLAIVLVSQGVVQTLGPSRIASLIEPTGMSDGSRVRQQTLAVGPAASQVAIKQLGTNGGGFFNANSAHPFENPTPASNLFEMLALILIPVALCYTFGRMVRQTRQGWALLAAMTLLFLPLLFACIHAEHAGNPALARLGVSQASDASQPGGNMEGKEARFGTTCSGIWAAATTAASNGS
ncbi:MAG TPA: potassium-transporting ATPase subunit KdpA, partial [bacterium]|nr:potassium-transporting ATPase subunit KdpA [bacterium]